jgi:hypothetical protein
VRLRHAGFTRPPSRRYGAANRTRAESASRDLMGRSVVGGGNQSYCVRSAFERRSLDPVGRDGPGLHRQGRCHRAESTLVPADAATESTPVDQ